MSDAPARSESPIVRVLVVDDNEDNRNLLSRRLRHKGYEVDVASDGPAALIACDRTTYDAVLLDVMMPGMSGIEVLERLRKTHGKTELPVIMATAKNDSVAVVDALKRGANDYVTKPIDFPVLLARLETQIAMKTEAAARAGSSVDVTFGITPGTILCGRYEILEKRGEGGFAVVYRAKQLSTKRDVALKHLRPDVLGADDDATQLERFERETRLIGELDHPNVVRLIDSGNISVRRLTPPSTTPSTTPDGPQGQAGAAADAGAGALEGAPSQTRRRPPDEGGETFSVPYIVMELLTGESFAELIEREAPLDSARAVDLILPAISALAAAHEKGVVHRDVKPSNIMLVEGAHGIEPKILDFGIAKLTTAGASDLTVSASLIGTPQYMSPEQALGKKDVDGRADQFSIASVLYQALSGKSLYQGTSLLELVSKVLAGSYTPLSEVRSDLPAGLPEVVGRALAPERDRRYPTVIELGRALLPFASEATARRWSDHFMLERKSRASDTPAVSIDGDAPEATATPATTEESPMAPVSSGQRPTSSLASTPPSTPSTVPEGGGVAGPTDPTVQVPSGTVRAASSHGKIAIDAPKTQRSEGSSPRTLESARPKTAVVEPKRPWERTALIVIVVAAVIAALVKLLAS